MIIQLSNKRKFIVKNKFETVEQEKFTKDEFDRNIITFWTEHGCKVIIKEIFKNKFIDSVCAIGCSYCNYKDKFDKKLAKSLAYNRAIAKLLKIGEIDQNEANELATFKLDCDYFTVNKNNTDTVSNVYNQTIYKTVSKDSTENND